MGVPVATILERKGYDVATIAPNATLGDAAEALTRQHIGALVVSDGEHVLGVLSERDVVRELSASGAGALSAPVSEAMAREVITCTPSTTTVSLMSTMTEQRVRHVPVLEDGRLVGIVSIGDVVKWRMDELVEEAHQLEAYVTGSY